MEIKICGIRRKEDIDIISKYKPDYIGFIFAKSKREVTPETVAEITKNLDKNIKKVGVFVNATYEKINEAVKAAKLDVVQLHGDENEEYISNLDCKCEIWKAVRVRDGENIYDVKGVDRLLLDKYTDKEYGGSGRTFDWHGGSRIKTDKPIVLAGGIKTENVIEGINIFKPVGVDISSSVETDGFKDEQKIKKFIETVRSYENE